MPAILFNWMGLVAVPQIHVFLMLLWLCCLGPATPDGRMSKGCCWCLQRGAPKPGAGVGGVVAEAPPPQGSSYLLG